MARFTDGPWEYIETISTDGIYRIAWINGKKGSESRQIICNTYIEDSEDEANLSLITAAPEIYQALTEKICNELCFSCEDEENPEEFCEIARVISKAEGKEVD